MKNAGPELPFPASKTPEQKIADVKAEHHIALPVELDAEGNYFVIKANGQKQPLEEWVSLQSVYDDTEEERKNNTRTGHY